MSKLTNVSSALTRNLSLKALAAKQNSPAIMFGAGVVGVVATVVLASRATLKLDEVLEEGQVMIAKANTVLEDETKPQYDEEVYKRDVTVIYAKTAINIVKLYGPAIIVGGLAIGALTGAHVTLTRRNGTLMAAYVALEKGFREYEARVRKEVGDEKARELKHGVVEREVLEETAEGEPVVRTVRTAAGYSQYAKLFEPTNPNWEPTPEHNLFFLKTCQTYLNDKLKARGYVMLNDVYKMLGLKESSQGQIVGWVYGNGDNYIDFGIWDDHSMERFHDFMVGRENAIWLDFNVDGPVWELLDKVNDPNNELN